MSTPAEPITKGIIVGILAILLLLAILGLYIWGSITSKQRGPVATSTSEIIVDIAAAEPDMAGHAPAQGSDELSTIETDLADMSLSPIDTELDAIEKDLAE